MANINSYDGMMRAQTQMDRASAALSNKLQTQQEDITKEVLDQNDAKNGFSLNARVARVQDNMLGTLLDTIA